MNEWMEKAPAKINLGLDIISRYPDGYHELSMIMASVDLNDYVTVSRLVEPVIQLKSTASNIPINHKNHVYQVATLLHTRYQVQEGASITLEKQIPVSAGLGGGSSDAAATLRALNHLWGLNLSLAQLAEIGAEIGSDIPYCIYGGCAHVAGKGEQVTVLPDLPKAWVVLVKPPFPISTSSIFKQVQIEQIEHVQIPVLKKAILEQDYPLILSHMGNVLEKITSTRKPEIQKIKECLLRSGADGALMSGSGPTIFALCRTEKLATRVANSIKGFCKEVYKVRLL